MLIKSKTRALKAYPYLLWLSFYEHFNTQFTYAISFMFKTIRFVLVKRFCASALFFVQLGTASPLKIFYMSLLSIKNLKKCKPPLAL